MRNSLSPWITCACFICLSLSFLSGCMDEYTQSPNIRTVSYEQFDQDLTPVENFGPGNTPAVYIDGYGGRTATVQIWDSSQQRMITEKTNYIPQNSIWVTPCVGLPTGSYVAMVDIDGSNVATCRFLVKNPSKEQIAQETEHTAILNPQEFEKLKREGIIVAKLGCPICDKSELIEIPFGEGLLVCSNCQIYGFLCPHCTKPFYQQYKGNIKEKIGTSFTIICPECNKSANWEYTDKGKFLL